MVIPIMLLRNRPGKKFGKQKEPTRRELRFIRTGLNMIPRNQHHRESTNRNPEDRPGPAPMKAVRVKAAKHHQRINQKENGQ